jgi:hypothetical protein
MVIFSGWVFFLILLFAFIAPLTYVMPMPEVVKKPVQYVIETLAQVTTKTHKELRQSLYNGKPWFGLCKAYAATSVQAFRDMVENDAVLGFHYRDFDWKNAHIISMSEEKRLHVSYRIPQGIFWTGKTILITKGEMLISDGNTAVRTFCCNQLASYPLGSVLVESKEPAEDALQPDNPTEESHLPRSVDTFTSIPFVGDPPTRFIGTSITPPVFFGSPPNDSQDIPRSPLPPLNPVPEPDTWILMATGIGVILTYRYNKRRDV